MYKAFIEPDLKAAHLRVYNTFNPFSGFMSPTYILKSARRVAKEDVCRVLQVRRRAEAGLRGAAECAAHPHLVLPCSSTAARPAPLPGSRGNPAPPRPSCLHPQPDYTVKPRESETYDIYLVPPGEDPDTCQSWLRMRYRDGRYNLMFEEWVVEGHFIISPRVTFEVPVRILGGLMALGYEIGTIMRRTSEVFSDSK
jgi:hypothetical protein